MNKILFFKLGALGDILMTTPLVREVRKLYPTFQIDYYVGEDYRNALEGNDDINNIKTFDQKMFFKKDITGVYNLFNKIKNEKYHIMFVLDKHWIASMCGFYTRIPERIGFSRDFKGWFNTHNIPYKNIKHEIHYYMELAGFLYSRFNRIPPRVYDTSIKFIMSKDDTDYAKEFFRKHKLNKDKTICIIPGGANNPGANDDAIRRWPTEQYGELINELTKKNFNIILVGGPGDVKIHDEVMYFVKDLSGVTNITNMTTLAKSAALMSKCYCVICNDSGPMHLASAVNNKVISLFGPTHPKRKAPLHKDSIAIWKDEVCYDNDYELYGSKKNLESRYMEKITTDDVMKHIKDPDWPNFKSRK